MTTHTIPVILAILLAVHAAPMTDAFDVVHESLKSVQLTRRLAPSPSPFYGHPPSYFQRRSVDSSEQQLVKRAIDSGIGDAFVSGGVKWLNKRGLKAVHGDVEGTGVLVRRGLKAVHGDVEGTGVLVRRSPDAGIGEAFTQVNEDE